LTRIAVIAVYIGKLPNWTQLWLKTCANNPGIQFFLATDQVDSLTSLPDNVSPIPVTLSGLRDRFSEVAGFKVELPVPYKICDYKPLFGLVFSEYLRSFRYWAHVDMDMLFGNISAFIPWESIEQYERLFHRGHFALFRNTDTGNNLFRLPHPDFPLERFFCNPKYMLFDETVGMVRLLEHNKFPQFERNDVIGDLTHKSPRMALTNKSLDRRCEAFAINDGRAIQIYENHGRIETREFMYFHFQKRYYPAPDFREFSEVNNFLITPQGFIPECEAQWTVEYLRKSNKPKYSHLLNLGLKVGKKRLATLFDSIQI